MRSRRNFAAAEWEGGSPDGVVVPVLPSKPSAC